MKPILIFLAFCCFLFSCSESPDAPSEISKEQAALMDGVDDSGADLCDQMGWYGDGICDDFCPSEDEDCDGSDTCADDSECALNETCVSGTCEVASSCADDAECQADEICDSGVCRSTGGACQFDLDCDAGEVCSNNQCIAASSCGFGATDCPADQFCDYAPGDFCGAADALGTCQSIPNGCDDIYDPVCGCDGNTYSNACEANSAGVSAAAPGECAQACGTDADCGLGEACVNGVCSAGTGCGGFGGITCGVGEFCDYAPQDFCGAADALGTCTPIPNACDDVFDPVCGCDSATYSNACEANANGQAVAAEGACEVTCAQDAECAAGQICSEGICADVCGTIAGLTCDDTQYCLYDGDGCGLADGGGTCKTRPEVCPDVVDPVCGCDGQTYENACEANANGQDVISLGACE